MEFSAFASFNGLADFEMLAGKAQDAEPVCIVEMLLYVLTVQFQNSPVLILFRSPQMRLNNAAEL